MTLTAERTATELLDAINAYEVEADRPEAEASDIRYAQAEAVAAALDSGLTQRQVADRWRRTNGTAYSHVHVLHTARTWRLFGSLGYQDRPLFNEAYHSPEVRGKAHVGQASGENEWYTPPEYIYAAAYTMGGIDLDPASSEKANLIVNAARFYTADDDGLAQDWAGRVWMNPPYAQPLCARFVEKLCAHLADGSVPEAVVLVNNATETEWFQQMAFWAAAIVFPKGRVKFLTPEGEPGAPLQGQAVIYFGPHADRFLDAYKGFGLSCRAVT